MRALQDGGVEVGSAGSRLQVRPRGDMYAFWRSGHREHRAAGNVVVGIGTGRATDASIFDDDATIAGAARCDDADVTNTTTIEMTLKMSRNRSLGGARMSVPLRSDSFSEEEAPSECGVSQTRRAEGRPG
jgi:hypothetical protein